MHRVSKKHQSGRQGVVPLVPGCFLVPYEAWMHSTLALQGNNHQLGFINASSRNWLVELRVISRKDTGELLNCWKNWRTRPGCQTGRNLGLVWWELCCPHHRLPDLLAHLSDPANMSYLDTRDCHWPCCLGCPRDRILLLLWLPSSDLASPWSLCLHVTGFSFKVQCDSLTDWAQVTCPNP